jgi:hypothetical protein
MPSRHRLGRITAAAALAAAPVMGALVAMSAPASAAALPSDCPRNKFNASGMPLRLCLYWGGNELGARFDEYQERRADYAGLTYPCNGGGYGGCATYVKNNAASAANPTGFDAYTFYNEHCSGVYDDIAPYSARNLNLTWNDEASYENPFLGDGNLGGC